MGKLALNHVLTVMVVERRLVELELRLGLALMVGRVPLQGVQNLRLVRFE